MRGQFIRGDGLVIPNNISTAGAEMILAAAFKNTVPSFWFGLGIAYPSLDMKESQLEEPNETYGYERKTIARSGAGWTGSGVTGNQAWLMTDYMTWVPVGEGFDKPIQRIAFMGSDVRDPDAPIFALSSPLPAPVILTPDTPLNERAFKYQVFL